MVRLMPDTRCPRTRSLACRSPRRARWRRRANRRESLHALSVVRFASVDVARRIGGDAVHREKLTRIAAAAAEVADLGERISLQDPHFLVHAVCDEHVPLLWIARERQIP